MQIRGLNKTTLLDYPEHVAATIFTGGCNFCCPFCHNADLVLRPQIIPEISIDEILTFLKKRKGILTGVCITGGEPTLQPGLESFIEEIKKLGYLVKLDTNGYKPDILKRLLENDLLDYVAMDIKNAKNKYEVTSGIKEISITNIEESVQILMDSKIPYEFRTTVVRQLHNTEDFLEIGEWLAGAKAYFLQAYRDDDGVISKGFSSYEKEEMEEFAVLLRQFIHRVELRGMD